MSLVFGEGDLFGIDLTSSNFHSRDNHRDIWAHVCAEQSPLWHPYGDSGFWVVSRHAHAVHVLKDDTGYGSIRGNVLDTLLAGGDSAGGKMLPVSDGASHRNVRNHILKVIEAKINESLAATIDSTVNEIVHAAVEMGSCDFAVDVARRVALAVIAELMDIPPTDRPALQMHAAAALASDNAADSAVDRKLAQAEIVGYFAEIVDSSASLPDSSFLRRLIDISGRQRELDPVELIFNCYSLLLGGDETARLSLTGAVKALAENPLQWRSLRSGSISMETAIEEILRWTSPAMHAGRTVMRARELNGQHFGVGEIVTIWMVSANFDPNEFTDPHVLDLSRRPNRHLSFGYGPHFCIGARLARMEFRAVLNALLGSVEHIEITGTPTSIFSNFLRGYSTLPVRLHQIE